MINPQAIFSQVYNFFYKWHRRSYIKWLNKNLQKKLRGPQICDSIFEFTNGPTFVYQKHRSKETYEYCPYN
jgi:hypothetical protein